MFGLSECLYLKGPAERAFLKTKKGLTPFPLVMDLNPPMLKFGTTHVGFYKPGSHLPMRFRIDVISPSQNFPFLTG